MASLVTLLPVVATLISLLFSYTLFNQWGRRRRIYQLVWFVSVLMFVFTTSFEVVSELMGWPVDIYRIYLVLAASQVAFMGGGTYYLILQKNVFSTRGLVILNATLLSLVVFFSWMMTISTITDYSALLMGRWEYPVVGIGTFSLLIVCTILAGRKLDEHQRKMLLGHAYLIFSIIMTLWMGGYAALANVDTEQLVSGTIIAGQAMAQHVRNFSPLLSVSGGFLLIGGALFSFIRTRFRFNLLIALGGLAIATGGAIARMGTELGFILYIGEVIGILLLYKGFVDSDKMIISHEKRPLVQQRPEESL